MTTRPAVSGAGPLPSTRFVGVAWALLFVNTLGFTNVSTIIPFPKALAQVITMGSLIAAFVLALAINPRVRIRPNVYLLSLSLLVLVALLGGLGMTSGGGAFFRVWRLMTFVAVLWLLSGWWRGDMRFARYHLYTVSTVLLSVVVGLIIKPGGAFSGADGRLSGTIWPIPAPQVAHYSAVAAGLAIIMWIYKKVDGRSAALIAVTGVVILVLSRTRTGLFGIIVGLVVCGLMLSFTNARARKFFGIVVAVLAATMVVLGGVILSYLARGQDAEALSNFTGRAKVWEQLLAYDRTPAQLVVGIGLTDKSFNGLPIDNAWYSIYHEEGWAGLVLVGGFLLALLFAIVLRPLNPERTCALFLVAYCISASYTEVGLGDASPYLLDLAVAASLVVASNRTDRQEAADRSREFVRDPAR